MTLYYKYHDSVESPPFKIPYANNIKSYYHKVFVLPQKLFKADLNNPHVTLEYLSSKLEISPKELLNEMDNKHIKTIVVDNHIFYSYKDYIQKS